MPRTPEQEALFQALERDKQWEARKGAIAAYTDAALAPFQAFTRGAAYLPTMYADATGNTVYRPERGDDTYQLGMAPWEAATNRAVNSGAEIAGGIVAFGPVEGAIQALATKIVARGAARQAAQQGTREVVRRIPAAASSSLKSMDGWRQAIFGQKPASAESAAQQVLKWPFRNKALVGINTTLAVPDIMGYNTEPWQDYIKNLSQYEEATGSLTSARKLLDAYGGIVGRTKKEQEENEKTYTRDLDKAKALQTWYKKPVGASVVGGTAGAAAGYGLSSLVTKDKVNRILFTLLGGGVGAVAGHRIGTSIQDAASISSARAEMYGDAVKSMGALRDYIGNIEKAVAGGPPVKPRI